MYLAWYDASKKLSTAEKIANACLRYQEKFGTEPTEVLLHPSIAAEVVWQETPGPMALVPRDNIAPNCFCVGTPEDNT